MRILVSDIVEYDSAAAQERLKQCFKGRVLARQQKILNAFLAGEWDECSALIHSLPYSRIDECPESEYVDSVIIDLLWSRAINKESLEKLPE